MKQSEIRNLKNEQLVLEVRALREKMFTLRQQMVTEKVADVSQFKFIRRDIARLLTEQQVRNPKVRKPRKARAETPAAATSTSWGKPGRKTSSGGSASVSSGKGGVKGGPKGRARAKAAKAGAAKSGTKA